MKPIRKFFADANDSFRDLFRRRRVSVSDPKNRLETRFIHISPAGFAMSIVATVFLIFCIVLALVAYTPVLDFLPGYRTDATKSRETLMRNLIRIDSLERKMNDMLAYNESIILVVDGKTPTMRSVQNDSLPRDKSIVPTSAADSLLRRQMESDGKYGIRNSASASGHTNINAVAPMDGIIAERFDIKSGLYGIRIAGAPESQIVAIADGTVILNDWSPENGNSVAIQHPNGMISVYRMLSGTLVGKGQRVKGSEVIGYSTAGGDNDLSTFAFELWSDGKPVDPESYILF